VAVEDVLAATGWELQVENGVGVTEAPTDEELVALRALKTKGRG
jgi:glutaconate CoA-transferase, subunit B